MRARSECSGVVGARNLSRKVYLGLCVVFRLSVFVFVGGFQCSDCDDFIPCTAFSLPLHFTYDLPCTTVCNDLCSILTTPLSSPCSIVCQPY